MCAHHLLTGAARSLPLPKTSACSPSACLPARRTCRCRRRQLPWYTMRLRASTQRQFCCQSYGGCLLMGGRGAWSVAGAFGRRLACLGETWLGAGWGMQGAVPLPQLQCNLWGRGVVWGSAPARCSARPRCLMRLPPLSFCARGGCLSAMKAGPSSKRLILIKNRCCLEVIENTKALCRCFATLGFCRPTEDPADCRMGGMFHLTYSASRGCALACVILAR